MIEIKEIDVEVLSQRCHAVELSENDKPVGRFFVPDSSEDLISSLIKAYNQVEEIKDTCHLQIQSCWDMPFNCEVEVLFAKKIFNILSPQPQTVGNSKLGHSGRFNVHTIPEIDTSEEFMRLYGDCNTSEKPDENYSIICANVETGEFVHFSKDTPCATVKAEKEQPCEK